jgi:hypothetical protein
MANNQTKANVLDAEQAATIASLWKALTESAEKDREAGVFLLMFGPWAEEQLAADRAS